MEKRKRKIPAKKILITAFVILIALAVAVWYVFSEKHDDTAKVKADYTIPAMSLIKEFETDITSANRKYAEKIIEVTGTVTDIETADTTINIKMVDTVTGSYLIFAFQQQHLRESKTLKKGDKATIRGSCSDGIFSEILGTYFISFKRSTLIEKK